MKDMKQNIETETYEFFVRCFVDLFRSCLSTFAKRKPRIKKDPSEHFEQNKKQYH